MSDTEEVDIIMLLAEVTKATRKLVELRELGVKHLILGTVTKQLVYVTEQGITNTEVSSEVVAYLLSVGYEWGDWPKLETLIKILKAYKEPQTPASP